MLEEISLASARFLLKDSMLRKEKIEIYTYGFQIIYSTLLITTSILLQAVLFWNIWNAILFFVLFIPIRSYSGGYHAESYLSCFLISNLCFTACCMFSALFTHAGFIEQQGILTASMLYIYSNSPVKNPNKEFSQRKALYYKKVTGILLAAAYVLYMALTLVRFPAAEMIAVLLLISISIYIAKRKEEKIC